MFEVLMYLFENYMGNNTSLTADQQAILTDLESAGFSDHEIDRALDWLEGLDRVRDITETNTIVSSNAMRHFLPEEQYQLGKDGIGFLLYLEQLHILDPLTREIVIDRVMAVDKKELNLGRLKWVVLIALFTQPDKKSALSLLQDMILSDAFGILH